MSMERPSLFLVLLYVATTWIPSVAAQPVSSANQFTSRNVYLAAPHVRPAALVEGDLMAMGGKVLVDQEVRGDASLAGGSVEIKAPIGDDLRVVGGDVHIASTIGGELRATGGNLTLAKVARIGRGASFFGGAVTIDGAVGGSLEVQAQKVIVNGTVSGDAELQAEEIELGENARIGGALSYATPGELRRAPGASVTGTVTRENAMMERQNDNANHYYWQRHMRVSSPPWMAWTFTFFALLACAAIFVLVFPSFADRASDTVGTSPWLALLVGFGALIGVPAFAGMLFISLLGIPVGILVLALYPALLLLGYLVGVLFVTQRVRVAINKGTSTSFAVTMGYFALSQVMVLLLARLPFVGALLIALVTVVGAGASVLALPRHKPTGPAAPPPQIHTTGVPST